MAPTATYDAELTTEKDWVRFLSGDRDIVHPKLWDEEIAALLVEERNKYLAAARACEVIMQRSGGLVMKQVGDLKLQFSDSAQGAYIRHITSLREKGCELLLPKPKAFRVLG